MVSVGSRAAHPCWFVTAIKMERFRPRVNLFIRLQKSARQLGRVDTMNLTQRREGAKGAKMRPLRCYPRFLYPVIPAKAGIQRVGNGVCVPPPPPKFRTSTYARANVNTPWGLRARAKRNQTRIASGQNTISLDSLTETGCAVGARASRPQSRACARRALILAFSHKVRRDPLTAIHA